MFCDKCGNPIPEGQDHCPNCQEEPMEISPEIPAESEEFTLTTPQEVPEKKKTVNLLLLAGGAAVLVALVGVIIAWACGAFRSPQQQLLHIEKTGAKVASAALAEGYEAYIDAMQSRLPMEDGYRTGVDCRLSLKEELWRMALGSMVGADVGDIDLSWIDHILLHMDVAVKGDRMGMEMGVGLNDTVLLSAQMLMDLAQNKAAVALPELNSQYLGMELTGEGMSPDTMTKSMELVKTFIQDLPEKDAVKEMLDRYLDIALGCIQTVEKSTKTVTAGELSKSVTVLKLTLTQEQLLDLLTQLATTAKTDETLKQFFTAFSSYYNGINAAIPENFDTPFEPEDLYADFLETLDELLADLEEQKKSVDPANYVVISNYVFQNVILGRKLEAFDADGSSESAHYLVLAGKDGYCFEAEMPDLRIAGSGKEDALECTLTAEGQEMLKVQTEGLEFAEDVLSGTVRLYPSEALLTEMGLEDSQAFMADLAGCYLEMVVSSGKDTGNVTLRVVAGGETLGTLTMDVVIRTEASITLPETTLDPENEADMEQWAKTLSFDKLIANMEAAKVPSDYVDTVRQFASFLSMQLSMAA